MLIAKAEAGCVASAGLITRPSLIEEIHAPRFIYSMECLDQFGKLKWREVFENLVTTVGKNDLLDKYFKGSTYTAAWFVSLIDADTGWSAVAAGDTMASHAGWQEAATTNPTYSNATRPALVLGTPSGGSVDNVASVAAFAINATNLIKGAFVTSVNTKDGTTGILYSAGAFAADRSIINLDTLNVTMTLTIS